MKRLLLATISTLTAFAFVAPAVSQKASAQVFEREPLENPEPLIEDDESSQADYDAGYQAGYEAGYEAGQADASESYEGYDDDDSFDSETEGVSRDGATPSTEMTNDAASEDEGLTPRFEEEFEETLQNE